MRFARAWMILSIFGAELGYLRFAQSAAFPCELKSRRMAQKITLSGETHENNLMCLEDRYWQIQAGSQGKYYVGLEGIYWGEKVIEEGLVNGPTARVFGYDDAFSYGLGAILSTAISMRHNLVLGVTHPSEQLGEEMRNHQEKFARVLSTNPYLRQAWEKLQRTHPPLATDGQESLAIRFDEFAGGRGSAGSFLDLLDRIAAVYIEMAKSVQYRSSMKVPQNIDLVLRGMVGEHSAEAFNLISIEWRNLFMAENIAKLYCQAAAEKKDLLIVTGKAHVPGLHRLLSQMSQGRVVIEDRDAETARSKIKALQPKLDLNFKKRPTAASPELSGPRWASARAKQADIAWVTADLKESIRALFLNPLRAQVLVQPAEVGLHVFLEIPESELPPLEDGVKSGDYAPGVQLIEDLRRKYGYKAPEVVLTTDTRYAGESDDHFKIVHLLFMAPPGTKVLGN